jgi:hypothetical protein
MAQPSRGILTIRDEQMAVFEVDARRRAFERLREHLRAACPSQTRALRDPQFLAEIEQGVAHAAQYGITAEADVRVFLECRLELGADFDAREDTAWAGEILRDPTLFGSGKADLLADRHMLLGLPGAP